ncbi:unnamed protein product [Linum tenue]|uniref:Uncharacterized protein n=1 Tax=Linum tenue TaxID=586396 RepID=A0AAV0JQG7_9ROSI|nr:unnamed protein product [Linum tenue]
MLIKKNTQPVLIVLLCHKDSNRCCKPTTANLNEELG